MKTLFCLRLFAAACGLLTCLVVYPTGSETRAAGAGKRMQGTFLQLANENGTWPIEKWMELFDNFRELGLSQLVVQWTVNDGIAFYPSASGETIATPPLKTILRLADEAHMQVYVGLVFDSGFWKMAGGAPADIDSYFRELLGRSAATAKELMPLVREHPSFKGWYVVQEVEDTTWSSSEKQQLLVSYLRNLSAFLHAITPDARVAISGFSNGTGDPKALANFWNALLHEVPFVSSVFFQDGIGTGHLNMANLPQYLAAMKDTLAANGREYQTIVEIFRQTSDSKAQGAQFRAVPAPLDQILDQLRLAAAFSSETLAFSVPEYMSSLAGPAAKKLYQDYLAELHRSSAEDNSADTESLNLKQ